MLTAVTQKAQVASVAPLPSISNRLSVVDFQKISAESEGRKSNSRMFSTRKSDFQLLVKLEVPPCPRWRSP